MSDTRNRPPKLRLRWGRIGATALALLGALMWLTFQTYLIHRLFTV